MELNIYKKQAVGSAMAHLRYISIHRLGGRVYLNALLCEELGLTTSHMALLAKDRASGKWYVAFGQSGVFVGGIRLRKNAKTAEARERTRALTGGNRKAANDILDDVDADRSAVFLVDMKPKEQDGFRWYQILTKSPVRIDDYKYGKP